MSSRDEILPAAHFPCDTTLVQGMTACRNRLTPNGRRCFLSVSFRYVLWTVCVVLTSCDESWAVDIEYAIKRNTSTIYKGDLERNGSALFSQSSQNFQRRRWVTKPERTGLTGLKLVVLVTPRSRGCGLARFSFS